MIKKLRIILLLTWLIAATGFSAEPTICLNMIVKDESAVITRCLGSIKHMIDYWVIVDTGSSDGTQKIIKEFMKDVPGELHERPWKNFEHNRNEALSLAKGKADYILFLDADEVLTFDADFKLPHLDKDFYHVDTLLGGSKYKRVQMINNHLDWKWKGVLHEAVDSPQARTSATLAGVYNIARPEGNRSRDPQKYHKDAAILEKALIEDPNNTRYVFYLAQSYRDAGELEKSIENYERRIKMGGWDEEIFWSKVQIGVLSETLEKDPKVIINAYLDAHQYRPTRAEPLYRLAHYLRMQDRFEEAFTYAAKGLSLPETQDILFVERWIYDYGLLLEYSVAAYWTDRFLEAQIASKLMLTDKTLPDNVRDTVNSNLVWIGKKLDETSKINLSLKNTIP